MDALTARSLLFQRQLTMKLIDWSIPGAEALDNQLAILELTEKDLQDCKSLAEQPDGTISAAIAGAAGVCKSLVLRETKERILSDNDAEAVSMWGHSVLAPLNGLIEETSALSAKALEAAKKNSVKTPENASDTSSPAS